MRTAEDLEFNGQRFDKSEWPEGALKQMNPKVIVAMFDVRNNLPTSYAMYPSPLYGAHVRNDDTGSRHSIKHGTRLSDATDFFCLKKHLPLVFMEVMKHPTIMGCGFYLGATFKGDDEAWAMVHIDTRPRAEKAFWVAEKIRGSYEYYSIKHEPENYFRVLTELCK